MADLTPTGALNRGVNSMTELLSNSATFKTLVGAANAAAALAHIKQYVYESATFPIALVDFDEYESEAIAGGCGQTYRSTFKVAVLIALPIPAGQINADGTVDARNAMVYMTNKVGAIITEIRALAGVTNSDRIANVIAMPPLLSPEHSDDDPSGSVYFTAELG
jgi:hypothetical protein